MVPREFTALSAAAAAELGRSLAKRGDVHIVRPIRSPGQVLPSSKGREIYQRLIGRAGRLLLRLVLKQEGTPIMS